MSKHYTPSLENKLQSELRRNGGNLPGMQSRYNKQGPYYKKPYEQKVYEKLKLPSVMELGQDGKTHINTGDQAKTHLGRMLSQSHRLPFNHSLLGDFQCINGFWSYLTSKVRNDRVRHLSGSDLRNFNRDTESRRVDNFVFILLGAQWEKINAHPKLKAALRDSTLPLDCYYITKKESFDLLVRPRHADWMIWGFEEIRKALKEDREPNFRPVMDDPDKSIFQCIFPGVEVPEEREKPKAKEVEQPALLFSEEKIIIDSISVVEVPTEEPSEVNDTEVVSNETDIHETEKNSSGETPVILAMDELPYVSDAPVETQETISVEPTE